MIRWNPSISNPENEDTSLTTKHSLVPRCLEYMVFVGRGFTSGGQESGSVFSIDMCKIQASKRYIESVPLVLKDKSSCFFQGDRLVVQLPFDYALASGSRTLNWCLETIYRRVHF